MEIQLFVTDAIQLEANPAAATDIRRFEEFLRRRGDQHLLDADRRRQPHGEVPVVVMVVSKHSKDFLANEESGFAVREFFRRLRQRGTNAPDAPQMFSARCGLEFSQN